MSLKDFFGSFTGATQARRLKDADRQATQFMQTGYNDATKNMRTGYDTSNKYYNQAYGLYDPMVQQGRNAYDLYYNALGLGGADKARDASNTIYNNPIFNDMNNAAQNRTNALFNARGDSAGGNAQVASQRALQDNLFNYLGMYKGLGDRGDNAVNNQANIRMKQGGNATDYYNNLGNLNYGYGATRGGQAINYGNARAQTDGIFMNNLINSVAAVTGGKGVSLPSFGSQEPVYSQAGTQANGGWETNATRASNNLSQYLPWNWGA